MHPQTVQIWVLLRKTVASVKVRQSYLGVINLAASTYSAKPLYMYKLINPRLQSEYIPEV